jgi:DNA replication and repair protein RecF
MHLAKLIVSQFRNIAHAELALASRMNIIVGDNGSGKTSLLEAIYYLGHAKSFRTPHTTQLINLQKSEFVLHGETNTQHTMGIKRSKQTELIKLDRQIGQKKSELAKALPMQIINPDVHRILDDSPRYRRRFLDWGVFHVEQSYWDHWRRYQNILKQRNAALKQHWDKQLIQSWNEELSATVAAITHIKSTYVDQLENVLGSLPHGLEGLEIRYQQGWPESHSFVDSLQHSFDLDRKTGFTKYGPHRSDLKITLNGITAKQVVSRGQQKYLACVLKIAQVEMFCQSLGFSPLFLVDDLFSELDRTTAQQVIELLTLTGSQLFITAIEAQPALSLLPEANRKLFHVKHGMFQEVI